MRLTFGDAMAAAMESARGFRWTEYAPFFVIFVAQLLLLAVSTQIQSAWAMSLVAPVTRWAGGEANLHYPAFFVFLPVLMGWTESLLYAFPGCVLIPMALLRVYARTDRALSLGAGAGSRLAGAVLPTLLAALLGVGVIWGWQRWAAPPIVKAIEPALPGIRDLTSWGITLLGGYVILSLLLYIPVAAVQARASLFGALGRGVRFGLRALLPTVIFAFAFAIPAIVVQFIIERRGAAIITLLRPEVMAALLALYALLSSLATYFTYAAAARLYRFARGND